MSFGQPSRLRNDFERCFAVKLKLKTPLFGLFLLVGGCAKAGNVPQAPSLQYPTSFNGTGPGSALLFNGESSWEAEVDSLAGLLYSHNVTYREVDSSTLNAMSLEEISKFNVLIIPGGYAPTIAGTLNKATHEKLREAVQISGMSYLGFCAGAWLAVAPAPEPGKDVSYGIGLVNGPLLKPNYLTQAGQEFAIVDAQLPNGSKRDLLWYGGPITPDTASGVIAKYPDGTPAVTEIWSGKGFVIISGLHPTATQPILDVLGLLDPQADSQAIAPDLAWSFLNSTLHQIPLQTF
jgi:glutamine amidotransferase-like uncharacterized protein